MSHAPGAQPPTGASGPDAAIRIHADGAGGIHADGDAGTDADAAAVALDHPHDFSIQKEVHRQIRNDPDYDDWEYGTEPLPQESWLAAQGSAPAARPTDADPAAHQP
jgi:hypothetical protein